MLPGTIRDRDPGGWARLFCCLFVMFLAVPAVLNACGVELRVTLYVVLIELCVCFVVGLVVVCVVAVNDCRRIASEQTQYTGIQ